MFVLDQKDTFDWPVEIEVPGEGRPLKSKFFGVFKRVGQNRLDDMLKPDTAPSDDDLVREVLAGWKEVKDESGAELEFNRPNMDLLLGIAGVRRSIAVAFFEAMLGAARRKN